MQPTPTAPADTGNQAGAQTCAQTGTLPLCKDCTHYIRLDGRRTYGSHDRCAHPAHGQEPVNGAPLDADCTAARHRRGLCGPAGELFEARASAHHETAGQPALALATGGTAKGGTARAMLTKKLICAVEDLQDPYVTQDAQRLQDKGRQVLGWFVDDALEVLSAALAWRATQTSSKGTSEPSREAP